MAQLMPLPLTVSCFSKIQIGFTFLVPAHPGSPGQRAVKRVWGVRLGLELYGYCLWLRPGFLVSKQQVYSSSPLRELTCHMGSHSVTCHPAEVTFPPLPQPKLVLD